MLQAIAAVSMRTGLFTSTTDMAVVVDLTKQKATATFSGSSHADINYATNFWQSVQLHPPMESRLVSSDIKQRLKVAPPSSHARNLLASRQEEPAALQDFMSRAKTMEHLEEYGRIQRFAEAKAQDKNLLMKRREEREKKEELSKNKGVSQKKSQRGEDEVINKEDYIVDDEDDRQALNQLDEFETKKLDAQDSDSD